jgi:hypothetical protein
MNYNHSTGDTINCSYTFRTPDQIGPTGSIDITVSAWDTVDGTTIDYVTVFGLGNLT